jgi:hypothetical protein
VCRRVNSRTAAIGLDDHFNIVVALTEPDQPISRIGLVIDYQYLHACSRTSTLLTDDVVLKR